MTIYSLNSKQNSFRPLAAAIALAISGTVNGATFTVTNINDSGAGSLRQAVSDANGLAGADEIVFSPSLTGQSIFLTGSELSSSGDLTIKGPVMGDPSSLTINGGGNSRIISSNDNLTLENLTLTGGVASGGGAISVAGSDLVLSDSLITGNISSSVGGGIGFDNFYSDAGITLNRTTISNNTSSQSGGGLFAAGTFSFNVILNQSTVSGNKVSNGNGGGISLYSYFGVNITLNKSTISNNSTANGRGGGIFSDSYHESNTVLNQSTISGNSATNAGGGIGIFSFYVGSATLSQSTIFNNSVTGATSKAGGLYIAGGSQYKRTVSLVNSILSGNSGNEGNIYVRPSNDSGSGIFAINSIFGDQQSELASNTSNILTNSPDLGILKDNGGLTETHLPSTNSPALDKGNNDFTPDSVDQRGDGFSRIQNGVVDIGAVERQSANPVATLTLVKSITNDNGGIATVSDFTLSATGPTPISGISGFPTVTNFNVGTGIYTLSENTVPGYVQTGLYCIGSADIDPSDGLTLSDGEVVTCTFNNDDQPANITLIKNVVNDHGGGAIDSDFTLTATGTDPNIAPVTGISGTSGVTNVEVNADTYTILESTLPGYLQSDIQCTGGSDIDLGNGLQLANGEVVECTITNDDQPATLTLLNTVINDDGGSATDSDWQLQAAGLVIINGIENEPAISSVNIPAGTYTLSVSNVAGKLELSSRPVIQYESTWECSAGLLSGNELTLELGETAVCTVTNNDISPQAIPTLSLTGLLSLISAFAAFFGWSQRSVRRNLHR